MYRNLHVCYDEQIAAMELSYASTGIVAAELYSSSCNGPFLSRCAVGHVVTELDIDRLLAFRRIHTLFAFRRMYTLFGQYAER